MKFMMWAAFGLALAASASAADPGGRSAYKAAREKALKARVAAERSFVAVSPKEDWKGWLQKNFPDRSASWPAECVESFGAAAGTVKWDFIGKGDIDRDGAPTALLVRVQPSPSEERLIVRDLAVKQCAGGHWKDLLTEGGDEVRLDAGDPEDKVAPGLEILLTPVDENGDAAGDEESTFYLPTLGRYGGEADREKLREGKDVLKARPRR